MDTGARLNSDQALKLLVEGNKRFVGGLRSVETFLSTLKLKELAENGQNPFSIVLTCSDSRIPTEILFDRGVGDLFVIRNAGNVVGSSVIASVEFAAQNLDVPLFVVMGHSGCGAIEAVLSHESGEREFTPHLQRLIDKIRPAIDTMEKDKDKASATNGERLHNLTVENVQRSARLILDQSAVLGELVEARRLKVVGALYNLHTGQVCFDIL